MKNVIVWILAIAFCGCATTAPVSKEKKPLSFFVPKAEAQADAQLIEDEHVYAGIQLLGDIPAKSVFLADQSDIHVQHFRLEDVAPFSFALVDSSDDIVVGITLFYLTTDQAEARDLFNASQKKMYQKYKKSDNIAIDHDGMAMWSFLTREKWVEYRAADMERRYNMPELFGRQKRLNTGIDDVLHKAAVSLLEPTKEMPFHSVAITYESHEKRSAEAEKRKKLEDSLDL